MPKVTGVRHIAGCMIGPGLDALDTVLVRMEGDARTPRPRLVGLSASPLGRHRAMLSRLARGQSATALQMAELARDLGELAAVAVKDLAHRHGGLSVDFVVSHGPGLAMAAKPSCTPEIFDPWPLVTALETPVLHSLHQADIALGGRGGPLTVAADRWLFPGLKHDALVLHLGAFAQVSLVPANPEAEPDGFDLGPCNLMLDGITRELFPDCLFDRDDQIASRGRWGEDVFGLMVRNRFFEHCPNRSASREDFSDAWVEELVRDARQRLAPEDILASAVEAVAIMVARAQRKLRVGQVILAGGGARHPLLVSRIRRGCEGAEVTLSDDWGVPLQARQAMALTVLGVLCESGQRVLLPRVTGARAAGQAGTWSGRKL